MIENDDRGIMHRAVQGVRANIREGTGIGVTIKPPKLTTAERWEISRTRRSGTYLRDLHAAETSDSLLVIYYWFSDDDAWTAEHEALFDFRLGELAERAA